MRSWVATLAAVVLLLVAAPPAHARQHTHADGSGDVHTLYDFEPSGDVPAHAEGDITRVQIRHNTRYIQLFMTFRSLGTGVGAFFNVQNGRHQNRHIFVGTRGASTYGLQITKTGSSQNLRCRGMRAAAVNTGTRTLAVTFPRTCFNNPKVVRLNAWASNGDGAEERTFFVDDALTAGYISYPYNYQSPVVWTPWVKRG